MEAKLIVLVCCIAASLVRIEFDVKVVHSMKNELSELRNRLRLQCRSNWRNKIMLHKSRLDRKERFISCCYGIYDGQGYKWKRMPIRLRKLMQFTVKLRKTFSFNRKLLKQSSRD